MKRAEDCQKPIPFNNSKLIELNGLGHKTNKIEWKLMFSHSCEVAPDSRDPNRIHGFLAPWIWTIDVIKVYLLTVKLDLYLRA